MKREDKYMNGNKWIEYIENYKGKSKNEVLMLDKNMEVKINIEKKSSTSSAWNNWYLLLDINTLDATT